MFRNEKSEIVTDIEAVQRPDKIHDSEWRANTDERPTQPFPLETRQGNTYFSSRMQSRDTSIRKKPAAQLTADFRCIESTFQELELQCDAIVSIFNLKL